MEKIMCKLLVFIILVKIVLSFTGKSVKSAYDGPIEVLEIDDTELLDCAGFEKASDSTALTAYFPSSPGDLDDDGNAQMDIRNLKLHTLQDFLANRSHFVTISLDASLRLPYGTRICIPELNQHFGRHIPFEVRYTNVDLDGAHFDQIEICVDSEANSYESIVNLPDVQVFIKHPHYKYL